jgi:endonuclease/exonuclease/phosphatase family metal-dependent hydrolase
MRRASLHPLPWILVALGAVPACGDSDAQPAGATGTGAVSSVGGAGGQGNAGDGGSAGAGAAGGSTGGGGGAGGGAGEGGGGGEGGVVIVEPPPGRLRVVAANLTSGNNQSYDPGHGIRILQGLDADVILLQEANYGSSSKSEIDDLVDEICAGTCGYVRGPPAEIPNAVLSRLPIVESGSWVDPQVSNRSFVWARLEVAGDADLWAVSVHFLSTNATARNLEAQALLAEIAAKVPSSDLLVLGGDFNTSTRTEAAVNTLGQLFVVGAPHPADHLGNDDTNGPRTSPYDWVVADADLAPKQIPVEIGQTTFPSGAVIDTRIYVPLAEIAPALVGDSGAQGMQHMAVVRDYWIE